MPKTRRVRKRRLKDSRIFIAVKTWRDDFEPQLGKSLTDEATLTAYESEIESFTRARS
ncbi:DUF3137 domain-containing protein [Campylobacter rectus]|uniref:DUF3137 domain-containing protein n=1 Tax=Campylobacter rectus TaxID=203 RepID=UPI0021AB5177|nr:DUF3137 domain-containing protein [Campylobacter rectus]